LILLWVSIVNGASIFRFLRMLLKQITTFDSFQCIDTLLRHSQNSWINWRLTVPDTGESCPQKTIKSRPSVDHFTRVIKLITKPIWRKS
jgi:hypothetical protein